MFATLDDAAIGALVTAIVSLLTAITAIIRDYLNHKESTAEIKKLKGE